MQLDRYPGSQRTLPDTGGIGAGLGTRVGTETVSCRPRNGLQGRRDIRPKKKGISSYTRIELSRRAGDRTMTDIAPNRDPGCPRAADVRQRPCDRVDSKSRVLRMLPHPKGHVSRLLLVAKVPARRAGGRDVDGEQGTGPPKAERGPCPGHRFRANLYGPSGPRRIEFCGSPWWTLVGRGESS